MKWMHFFRLLACLIFASACFAESPKTIDTAATTVRGKLIQHENQTPAIELADHKLIALEGDGSTERVLHDKRIAALDLEAKGHFTDATHFQVDPFHTHALHVIKDGKRLLITYWCDVCSIRQYEPGPCWCCQRETALALKPEDE
jgi:hypothetical protein